MSGSNSELTFVRCPSCRSLVPAVSTRCRMCGASLEPAAGGVTPEEESEKAPSRVRQRTASTQTDSEFAETRDKLREERVGEETIEGHLDDLPGSFNSLD